MVEQLVRAASDAEAGSAERALEDLFETITRGNVTEVKVVLASVVAALAIYQVLLMAVCYGRLRIGFLQPPRWRTGRWATRSRRSGATAHFE